MSTTRRHTIIAKLKSFPSGKTDKSISIRHSYRRQRLCIDRIVLSDHAVELQDVGDHRVYLVIAERFGFVQRHGASHVVEDGRGVGPETADGLDRRLTRSERSLPTDQLIVRLARAFLAVTREAFGEIDLLALLRSAAHALPAPPLAETSAFAAFP